MRRLLPLVVVAVVASVAAGMAALYGRSGSAQGMAGGDTTALAIAGVSIALVTIVLLAVAASLLQAPAQVDRERGEARRRARQEALGRGFLALGAGDATEARRWAAAADPPGAGPAHPLSGLLEAWAAEADGDLQAAVAAYERLLAHPEARMAALRGLMLIARRRGDEPALLAHAEAALAVGAAPWAWRAQFDTHLRAGRWSDAAEAVEAGVQRRIFGADVAERLRWLVRRQDISDPRAVDRAFRPGS